MHFVFLEMMRQQQLGLPLPAKDDEATQQQPSWCCAIVHFIVNFRHVDVVQVHDDGRWVVKAAQRVEKHELKQSRAIVVHEQAELAEVFEHAQHFVLSGSCVTGNSL
jgi:hypothetical protein